MIKLPKNKLKLLYIDILNCYSIGFSKKFGKIYIKHFTNFDVGDVDVRYEEIYEMAKSKGLPSLQEKEEYLVSQGFWSKDQENKIAEYKFLIQNLRTTKSKLFRKQEIDNVSQKIEENSKKLDELILEKEQLIGLTAESFASKKINEYYIQKSFFVDFSTSIPLFDTERFEELEEEELLDLINVYNSVSTHFNEYNFKKISLSPFFFNFFGLANSAFEFFGTPVINLTFYQSDLYGFGLYFKNLLSNLKNKPPDHLFEDPDQLIEWVETNNNAPKTIKEQPNIKQTDNPSVSSIIGLSKEDRERLNIQEDSDSHSNLVQAAIKKGGELNFNDIIGILGK